MKSCEDYAGNSLGTDNRVRDLFNSRGQWIAFLKGKHMFDTNGNWVGWLPWKDNDVVDTNGEYMGTIVKGYICR
jgi:hypothetical protein